VTPLARLQENAARDRLAEPVQPEYDTDRRTSEIERRRRRFRLAHLWELQRVPVQRSAEEFERRLETAHRDARADADRVSGGDREIERRSPRVQGPLRHVRSRPARTAAAASAEFLLLLLDGDPTLCSRWWRGAEREVLRASRGS
jgi:hypothetical protein